MITEQDLNEAIAECKGQRNPTASTCIRLAAFLTIQRELYGAREPEPAQEYSYATPPSNTIEYDSGTEFSQAVTGRPQADVFPVLDDLMDTLYATNKPLYKAVLRNLTKG